MQMIKKIHFISLCYYSLFLVFSSIVVAVAAQNDPVNVGVGVVLDSSSGVGKMGLSCINMSLTDFYASHPNYTTRLLLHQKNSSPEDVVLTAAAALDLINNDQVQAIIGPQSSMQANFLISLGDKAHVPIISFSASSPSLTSIRSPYFIRAGQNDSSQVKALSALIQAFGWRQVVPIYVDNEFGEGVIPYLSDALQQVDVRIPYRTVLPSKASDEHIEAELLKLVTMQTRVFVVHMLPELGSRVFEKAKKLGMMEEGYVWIMTDGMSNLFSYISSSSVMENMQGVLGVKTYVPSTNELEGFRVRWKRKFQEDNPGVDVDLGVFGFWAYDAATALATAVEEVVRSSNGSLGFQKSNSSGSSNDLERIGVSIIGSLLVEALWRTNFLGLSGRFSLQNGQLQSSTFQIVNVIGSGEKVIGYWTPQNGLVRSLNSKITMNSSYSTSNTSLGSIIWPGDSISAPKGWQIPTSGKKLKILVPVKSGFKEFVNVTFDPKTNTSMVMGGYCIEVFKAVKEALPYDIEYDLVAFAKPNGSKAGNYNDLANEVYLGNYDAAVGDITIRANRSLYIDFTLPFTESGVSMIVPIKDNKNKNAWVFLKPLTWDLWATSGCFFIFIGFVVWVLEHRINEDFRGPPPHQIGTSLWFSFSTMVFAHRERVVSNLARFIMIIWVFVVLILTINYTASLSSLYTAEQLKPVTDINDLLRNQDNVGYFKNCYVYDLLKQVGFNDSKLKAYERMEEVDEALSKGTANDGIAAVVHGTPKMKLFLAKYCSKYTMIEAIFRTDGFAFVRSLSTYMHVCVSEN
uniref:glutamate receptor 2.7-like isoform X4 n=1 Tax=Fragaria vesca subsp. vesca TaxID=101020 RepID=UPI0005C80965|nr:PREDICTED: glutamate receptor 2.7-like isoform X4 [Fragaria vesca subsp. vesca]